MFEETVSSVLLLIFLFALMDQAFPRAQIQPHGHNSLQGETRSVGHLVPKKKGTQSCEQ